MQTYTLESDSKALSAQLGMKLTSPTDDTLSTSVFDTTADDLNTVLKVARDGASRISADIRSQGGEVKNTQVLVAVEPRLRSAVEDALKAEGLKPVYLEHGKDDYGVASSYLRAAQNISPATRMSTESGAVSGILDSSRTSEEVTRAQTALKELTQGASTAEIREKVGQYVAAVDKEFDKQGVASTGRAIVVSPDLPPSVSSLVESHLQEKGVTPLHSVREPGAAVAGIEVAELHTGANALAGLEARGMDALRKALGPEGKQYDDSLIRDAVGTQDIQRLGGLSSKERSADAGALALANESGLKDAHLQEIASRPAEADDAFKSKHEFPSGVPRDATVRFWIGEKSNVVAGWGGTSADMARGMDRTKEFLHAKGHDVTKDEMREVLGKAMLEKIGRDGFDAKKFEATHSALTATAQAVGAAKPTALDALYTQQRAENFKLNDDIKVMSDGKEVATLGAVREKLLEHDLVQEKAHGASHPTPERGQAGAESARNESAATSWEAAFSSKGAATAVAGADAMDSKSARSTDAGSASAQATSKEAQGAGQQDGSARDQSRQNEDQRNQEREHTRERSMERSSGGGEGSPGGGGGMSR